MGANATLLLPLPGLEPLVARVSGVEVMRPTISRFDNGELQVRLPGPVVARDCVLLGTAAPPADRLLELLLVADTVRRDGARSLSGLLPYLAYARQDKLEPGHSLAAAWLGSALAASGIVDVTTFDIHSPRALALMGLPVTSMSPAPLFARALDGALSTDTVVVAPDGGARARAAAVAEALGLKRAVAWLDKERGPRGVTHRRVIGEVARHALVVDDILDTGATLASCCRELRARGVEELTIAVTHGLFTGSRWHELLGLGVSAIHTTDSVPRAGAMRSSLVHVHSIAPLLAEALRRPAPAQAKDAGAADSSIGRQRSASRSAT